MSNIYRPVWKVEKSEDLLGNHEARNHCRRYVAGLRSAGKKSVPRDLVGVNGRPSGVPYIHGKLQPT